MSPVGECLEKGKLTSVTVPPTPVSLFSMWDRGGSLLSQPFWASPYPWSLKFLHGHCFVFLLEDLGVTDGTGLAPKACPGPSSCAFLLSGVINVL